MWYYTAAVLGMAVSAEVLGLGGIPAHAVEAENILFVALLLAFIVTAYRRFMRR